MKNRWKLLVLLLLTGSLLYLHGNHHITAEEVLSWQPNNLLLGAVLILLLFAVKSMLVIIPIMLPQILAGHLYSRDTAFFLNLLGLVIVMSVPYWIGRCLGSVRIQKMLTKYPRIQNILDVQDDNKMAFSFMLRACCVPPADIVTMYLGASGMPYVTNVMGGVLGSLPGMVLTTFLGANIRNPESPAFWKALTLNVAWVLLSGLGFCLLRKFNTRGADT